MNSTQQGSLKTYLKTALSEKTHHLTNVLKPKNVHAPLPGFFFMPYTKRNIVQHVIHIILSLNGAKTGFGKTRSSMCVLIALILSFFFFFAADAVFLTPWLTLLLQMAHHHTCVELCHGNQSKDCGHYVLCIFVRVFVRDRAFAYVFFYFFTTHTLNQSCLVFSYVIAHLC